jgi:hypothetical protein
MSTEIQMLPTASAHGSSDNQYESIPTQIDDDWSFASLKPSKTSWGPHGYHRYPAKFIPQLVRRLIDAYSLPGDLVGDTFVGSATTAIEALRSGRRFWGSDINSIALVIGRAKAVPECKTRMVKVPSESALAWSHQRSRGSAPPRAGLDENGDEGCESGSVAHSGGLSTVL